MLLKPIIPEPNSPPKAKVINLPSHIGVHSKLALEMLKYKANTQYAFVIWASLRSYDGWFYTKSQIEAIAQKTGKSGLSISRWLIAGEGIFWNKGFNKEYNEVCYYWIGAHSVGHHFGLESLGTVLSIYTDTWINKKLQHVRANFKDCLIVKESKIMSRKTIEVLTGVLRRTQQNYDDVSQIRIEDTYVHWRWIDELGKEHTMKQMPNIYYQRFEPFYEKKKDTARYNPYTLVNNALETDASQPLGAKSEKYNGRFFFNNKQAAYNKVLSMRKKDVDGYVLYKSGDTFACGTAWKVLHTHNVFDKDVLLEFSV